MALIDRYIEPLKTPGSQAITLRTGAGVDMMIKGASKSLSSTPVPTNKIMSLLEEVLPSGFQDEIEGSSKEFDYQSPLGPVKINVMARDGNVSVRIVPPGESSQTGQAKGTSDQTTSPEAAAPKAAVPKASQTKSEPAGPFEIDKLFHHMLDMGASDLHLKSGNRPMIRQDGSMAFLEDTEVLSHDELFALLRPIMPQRNVDQFEEIKDTDFSHQVGTRARMRSNVFMDLAGVGAVFRQIPSEILTIEQLKVPKAAVDFCDHSKGLVLVTGPTGSGKSTTLAALIDYVNETRSDHLITIEDPIEFVHPQKKCLINQREVGTTTMSFKNALRAALREDPDIVLLGELRDLETTEIAIETAETGHLVFGTLHTNTAASTVDRMIDQFPADRQSQIRAMLSESLIGVISQTLCKKIGGGRVAALEILVITSAVSNLIREGKTFQIPSIMQTSKNIGMQTLNDVLCDLVKSKTIAPEEAYMKSVDKKSMVDAMAKVGIRYKP